MKRASRYSTPLLATAIASAALLSACGDGGGLTGGGGPDAGTQEVADLAQPPDLAPPPARLVESEYTIPAGKEFYQCQRLTAKEDTFIKTIIPGNNPGLHHLVLAIDPTGKPDGISTCGPLERQWITLFASGVNSPPLTMPEGVALKVPAGKQIVLDMHLFNAGLKEIQSKGWIDVHTVPAASVREEAEVVLAGPAIFNIPPGDDQIVRGGCRMTGNTNFFAVFPHMHQIGKHIRIWAVTGGSKQSVYDAPYQFEEQDFKSFAPIPMQAGDRIEVECTYNNTTGQTVKFGDSSKEEMCFAISYRYPKLGAAFGGICPF